MADIADGKQIHNIASAPLLMLLFAMAVFFGAFLLFAVQPIMGRFILPWFGGTPAVWTTCMLLFQLLLLGGYLYAHLLTSYFRPVRQAMVHVFFALLCLLFLPILPESSQVPQDGTFPALSILLILMASVGGPYLLLSATGPLMQSWFGLCMPGKSPFRLYALSNIGSLLALLSYPFVVEPLTSRIDQVYGWSWLMAGFVFLLAVCSYVVFGHIKAMPESVTHAGLVSGLKQKASKLTIFFWIAFPAIASIELLAITSRITQDIAAIPFLWILPLSVYLLTFIICFDSPRWYKHFFYLILLIIAIGLSVWFQREFAERGILSQITLNIILLFACCMLCHGQLYHLRPQAGFVTGYYLFIATGGVLGGVFVALIAPLIFKTDLELNLGLLGCISLTILADIHNRIPMKRRICWASVIVVISLCFIFLSKPIGENNRTAVYYSRNFFGTLTIWQADAGLKDQRFILQHGTTFHGIQYSDPARHKLPTAYYGYSSGVGLAFEALNQSNKPLKVGVVGLGVGTVATYSKPGDIFAFYEINPEVISLASDPKWFTYLSDFAGAHYDIYPGDARLVLSRQQSHNFDLLIIDAFSSDSVPVHLLTRQALDVFLGHLAGKGILAFHLSNNHLDLPAVVQTLASHAGLNMVSVTSGSTENATFPSNWVLLSRESGLFSVPPLKQFEVSDFMPETTLWTDDQVNLLEILKTDSE